MQEVGRRWWIEVAGQRLQFRHDESGSVSMLEGKDQWVPVETRWIADRPGLDPALCWDGVCALGEIPLD